MLVESITVIQRFNKNITDIQYNCLTLTEKKCRQYTRFGAEKIHNTKNVIRLPHGKGSIHAKISGYYSSKPAFANGMTVRQWLSTQSYEKQYKFGIKTLKQSGWKP